jgi:VanZ family protein
MSDKPTGAALRLCHNSERLPNDFQVQLRDITYKSPSGPTVALLIVWGLAWAGFGIPWTGMTNHAHWGVIRWSPIPPRRSIDDAILNFLFYIPLGILGRRVHRAGVVIAVGFACSLTTELIQLFSHTRTPTLLDVVVNTAGTIVGVALQSRMHSRARTRADAASPQ